MVVLVADGHVQVLGRDGRVGMIVQAYSTDGALKFGECANVCGIRSNEIGEMVKEKRKEREKKNPLMRFR